jgi:hypothetical protein
LNLSTWKHTPRVPLLRPSLPSPTTPTSNSQSNPSRVTQYWTSLV